MKIRLIVPHNCSDETSGYHERTVHTYGRQIARIAGGFTATQATGGWVDGSNLLVVEPVTVFDCYVDVVRNQAGRFDILARKIARELRQASVYLEIDGETEFVTA